MLKKLFNKLTSFWIRLTCQIVFWRGLCLLCWLSSSAAKSDYITCPKNHHKVFHTLTPRHRCAPPSTPKYTLIQIDQKKRLKNSPISILLSCAQSGRFVCPLKLEKKSSPKVAHNRPIFFSVLTRLQKRPKNRNPVPPKAPKCRTGYLDWVWTVWFSVLSFGFIFTRWIIKSIVYCVSKLNYDW